MVNICFYFQVHQPFRLRRYPIFDIGKSRDYFDSSKNISTMRKVADKCYLPMNRLLLNVMDEIPEFKASFSVTGTALEQFEQYCPEVLDSFKELKRTGRVEFLSETYHHTLAYLYSKDEFREQVEMHRKKIKKLFGAKPKVFRNTELIYNNEIAAYAEKMGFKAILAEGWDHYLQWRSPNFVYTPYGCSRIKLLLKNYKLSDDIAFRFSNRGWSEWPLTAERYASWVSNINGNGTNVNLFMDYETFGEHQWKDTGVFDFMRSLPRELLKHPDNSFTTPSEAAKMKDVGEIDIPYMMSWADLERDLSAWTGNKMQQSAVRRLYMLEKSVKESGNKELIELWRKLQTSDHLYYMCTKYFSDGDVHKYFNPYDSPYDAFITFMNILHDLSYRVNAPESSKINKCAACSVCNNSPVQSRQ